MRLLCGPAGVLQQQCPHILDLDPREAFRPPSALANQLEQIMKAAALQERFQQPEPQPATLEKFPSWRAACSYADHAGALQRSWLRFLS